MTNYCDLFSIHKYWPEFVCCEHCVALYKRTPHKYIRLGFFNCSRFIPCEANLTQSEIENIARRKNQFKCLVYMHMF